jgi:pilus assembly protein CpaB
MRSVRMPLGARARLLRRARVGITGLLLALAGLTAMPRPPGSVDPTAVEILVAAHDMAGGVLTATDLRTARLPAAAVPAGALPVDGSAVGRRLAGAVRRGEPLTDARVIGPALARLAGGPGSVVAPIRLADAAVTGLIHPGDRVNVIAVTGSGGSSTVASGAEVLAVPPGPGGDPGDGALVVLAVPEWAAARVVASALEARLAVTLQAP